MSSRRQRRLLRRILAVLVLLVCVFAAVAGYREFIRRTREERLRPLRKWTRDFRLAPAEESALPVVLTLEREGRHLRGRWENGRVLRGYCTRPTGFLPNQGEAVEAGRVLLRETAYLYADPAAGKVPIRRIAGTVTLETTERIPSTPESAGYILTKVNTRLVLEGRIFTVEGEEHEFEAVAEGLKARYQAPSRFADPGRRRLSHEKGRKPTRPAYPEFLDQFHHRPP